ncbi:MAG: HelD family protein [Phycisphaerales bacterium]
MVRTIEAEVRAFGARLDARLTESHDMAVAIQEHKRDMDHAEKAVMRQSVNVLTSINEEGMANYRKLVRLVESPYFGRIDLADDDVPSARPVYIGLHSFADPDTTSQMVHDWRAPISSMFYDFELGPAHCDTPSGRLTFDIVRKRQYQIEKRSLKYMLDTSLSIQDDILREELSRTSDNRMRNIVATIQREQNTIIRNDRTHALIIQGAAGSGKTSIALHRIAFLLYRFRDEISSSDILIVSPNKVFASYISTVLPELGEEMIQETTMESIAGTLLGAGYRFESFAEQVWTLLEDRDQSYADRVRFKATPQFLEKLDEYIAHMRDTNFTPRDVSLPPYTLDSESLAQRFRPYAAMPLAEQITRVVNDTVDFMDTKYQRKIVGRDRARVRAEITAMFRVTTLPAIYKAFYEWLGAPQMFRKAKGGRYEYADVFPMIYLSRLLAPVRLGKRVKHIVIDEMQDYTPVQYRVIDMLFACKKTILGDYNQSVSPLSASSAEAIRGAIRDAECMYMHKSYRSTMEITAVAQSIQHNPMLQPIERHGEVPALMSCADLDGEVAAIREAIGEFRESGHKSLGIICKNEAQARRLHDALRTDDPGVTLLDTQSTTFSGGVMIATAYLAKGLEFDRVVVPHCDDDNYRSDIDKHMLYIACTRAMHSLIFTHTGVATRHLASALRHGVLRGPPQR